MDLQLKKLSISILNCATSKRLKTSSFRTSQKTRKSVSRTPRSSYQCHSSSMVTFKHVQPRSISRSMETTIYQRHVSSGFGYMVVSTDPQYTKPPVIFRGDNVVYTFLQRLDDEQRKISNILSVEKPMVMTAEDVQRHQQANECFTCDQPFGAERPVRDHDHLLLKVQRSCIQRVQSDIQIPKI